MAGHSKWANIKHRKAAQDSKRAKVFTRAIKEITIAARDGGGELDTNPSLRLAVQNAKGANMPKDTIERAIKKGVGGEGANLVEITFEGYASNGIAVFVEATTDNKNRTVASVRSIFNKYGGSLGTNGSLGFLFERKGIFTLKKESLGVEDLEELVKASPEYFPGFAKGLTDIASVGKKITGGGAPKRGRPKKAVISVEGPPKLVRSENVDIDMIEFCLYHNSSPQSDPSIRD